MTDDDSRIGRNSRNTEPVDHYGASFTQFETSLYEDIRADTFGEDIGQTGWLTASEQDRFLSWLELTPDSRVLDVACGSGGPTLRLARLAGCGVVGIDIHEDGIAAANSQARRRDMTAQARFQRLDASRTLPFADESFDAILCIDAINHLADRSTVLSDWKRILKPGGRLVFTDPIVVTGPLSSAEIAIRCSIGFMLFVPQGTDESLLEEAGLALDVCEDRTSNLAEMAGRWRAARSARAEPLIKVEGKRTYEGQQEFFRVAELIAAERRLSRFAFAARKPI